MTAPQSAEKDARCNVCGQSLDTFPCPVSWDSEHRPRHDETRPIPPGGDGCIAMSGGGFRHSSTHNGVCTYCGASVLPPATPEGGGA